MNVKSVKAVPIRQHAYVRVEVRNPLSERNKRLYVSKTMKTYRAECMERITTDYGKQLRMNRSIQVEGSFAMIKGDMDFRRYLYSGLENVTAQSILLATAYNVTKLHHKIQNGYCGKHLFALNRIRKLQK